MASSKLQIWNLALSHLNIGKEVQGENESSQEAAACRRFYDFALSATLRDFEWPFATAFVTLALVAEHPTSEWIYAYRYPSDCVKFRRILSGTRNDTAQSKISYRIARDTQGRMIYTDRAEAEAEYTLLETDTSRYSDDFVIALSLRLASYICPRLTAGDPFKLRQTTLQLYAFEINTAQANAASEERQEQEPESELLRSREE